MTAPNVRNLILLGSIGLLCLGCSAIDKFRGGAAPEANNGSTNSTSTTSSPSSSPGAKTSPCTNKYSPVADGAVKTYKMSAGGKDTKIVQAYTSGSSEFSEETTVGGTTVKHEWKCTAEGLIAANPGSMMNSSAGQSEPKHISGVTLPIESEIRTGKEWKTVYQSSGKSPAGNISTDVTINNKIVAMDDEVKVPGGTFKAVKIEALIDVAMKMNGGNVPVPQIKSYIWFAPGVGMVKSMVAEGSLAGGSSMEYSGDK